MPQEATDVFCRPLGFGLAALHFTKKEVEHFVEAVRVERVSAPFEVFAFTEETRAECQAIQVLFVGKGGGGDGVELGQGGLTGSMMAAQSRQGCVVELSFARGQANVGCVCRMRVEERVEIIV